jgi:hypothetical protein
VAVPMQPRQQKYCGFLGIETEFVGLPAGPPTIVRHASLDTVQAMPQCICSCHSVVRKDVKGLFVCRSTSAQRCTLELHPWALRSAAEGINLCFISHTLVRMVVY